MLTTVAELPEYIRRADRLLSALERTEVIGYLAAHPKAGYVMTLFGKNEKANLSRAERNELAQLVGILKAAVETKR